MQALSAIAKEIWGLFVDDGSLALALVAWCAVGGLGLPLLPFPDGWETALLFAGVVAILLENVRRAAARR